MGRPHTEGFFVHERLIEARDARNVTQKELATSLGVSHPTVSRWEHGDRIPDSPTLNKLADALGVSPTYFLKPMPDHGGAPIFFRSLASAAARARTKERAKVRWLQHISLTLQASLELPEVDIPEFVSPGSYARLTDGDLENIASEMRAHWKLGQGPIRNMALVAENAGVVIGIDEVGSTTIDGQANWSNADNRPYILLARDKFTAFRRQMDIAHELSHVIAHRGVSVQQLAQDFDLIEHQAKYLAGAFLLPQRSFVAEIPSLSLDGFLSLKPRWMVAIGAMIMRAEQLRVLSEEGAKRMWKYRATRGWAKREPLDSPSVTPVEIPRLLRRSFEEIVSAGVRSKRDLLETDLGLGAPDVEMLASLPNGFFAETPGQVVRLEPRLRIAGDTQATGHIVPFKRTT